MLDGTIEMEETFQGHAVITRGIISDSQTVIQRAAHLEPGLWKLLAMRINRRTQALLADRIATEIH